MRAGSLRCLAGAFWVLVWAHGPAAAEDAPTLKDQIAECRAAEAERSELIRGGVVELYDKGVEWARSSAKPEELGRVRRFIALQERLMFGCSERFPMLLLAGAAPPLPERRPDPPPSVKRAPAANTGASNRPENPTGVPLPVRKGAVL